MSREIGAAFAANGAHFLDAPCTGSKPGAEKGTLTFMIGGDKTAFERAQPLLRDHGEGVLPLRRSRAAVCKPS